MKQDFGMANFIFYLVAFETLKPERTCMIQDNILLWCKNKLLLCKIKSIANKIIYFDANYQRSI